MLTPLRTGSTALLSCLVILTAGFALADEPKNPRPPEPVTTEHQVTIAGKPVSYKATAGTLPVQDDNATKTKANIFYIAYTRTDLPEAGAAARPITFAFNGGPGSSSVWLHMGALGPRRVKFGVDGERLPEAQTLVDNETSWLDFTDLVFIDPVSTGFSRAIEGEDPHQFHGLDEDAHAVADFIRLYLVRSSRWASPKFLCGESYGTTRASALAPDLQSRLGVYINGIVLISPVLYFQTLSFDLGNDLIYPLYLPSYAATAFYHKKLKAPLDSDLQRTIDAAREYADGAYTTALMKGDNLKGEERSAVARRLSELTGLSTDFLLDCNLRPSLGQFTKELLRDQSRTVGRLDSRYKGIDRTDAGGGPEFDASYAAIQGPFTAALNTYMRSELKYEFDMNYEILTGAVHPWRFPGGNRYTNVAESLRSAMAFNTNLKVLACSGWFDFATPAHAMTWTMTHLGLEESIRKNISQTFYKAGHMMYIRDDDRAKLREDVMTLYRDAIPAADR